MKKSEINHLLVLHLVSVVVIFESFFMFLAVLVSLIYNEPNATVLSFIFLLTFLTGFASAVITRRRKKVEPSLRDSFIIVTLAWITMAVFGTLPYIFTKSIPGFTNAFFESMSGFTTTGSSVLTDIESLPKSMLFWRAETHWIGGMGIIVLMVALMPFIISSGNNLFYSETSVLTDDKISARVRSVSRNMWGIYVGFTFLETVLLLIGGMPVFDSICHSFATVATGGFSTQNDSIAGYSPFIQYVIALFMLLSGINYTVHFLLLKGNYKQGLKNEEFRLYLKIIVFVGGIITLILFYQNQNQGFEAAFRNSFFQVISILTATGFATSDYLIWPTSGVVFIAVLMLIGASSGSTGGGVKVVRHVIAYKKISQVCQKIISPKRIKLVRYNNHQISRKNVNRILNFIFVYYLIIAFGTVIMTLFTGEITTSFGSVATSLAGIGPGFGSVGPSSNFALLPQGAKYFLTFLMLVGRLEIFSVIAIFSRSFWVN